MTKDNYTLTFLKKKKQQKNNPKHNADEFENSDRKKRRSDII